MTSRDYFKNGLFPDIPQLDELLRKKISELPTPALLHVSVYHASKEPWPPIDQVTKANLLKTTEKSAVGIRHARIKPGDLSLTSYDDLAELIVGGLLDKKPEIHRISFSVERKDGQWVFC